LSALLGFVWFPVEFGVQEPSSREKQRVLFSTVIKARGVERVGGLTGSNGEKAKVDGDGLIALGRTLDY
jgi:hypothetical protein